VGEPRQERKEPGASEGSAFKSTLRAWKWAEVRGWRGQTVVVLASVGAMTALRLALQPALQERGVFIPFLLSVAVSAHLGGLRAGLASSALSLAVGAGLFLEASGPASAAPEAWLQMAMFLAVAVAITLFGAYLHAYRLQLHAAIEREHRLRVSEMAARAEAEHANRVKDEFLAILSHELRSPLNAIVGWAHILKAAQAPDERTKAIDTILRNADHQVRMISEIFELSRAVTGKLVLEATLVDVRSLLDQAIDSVRLAADARGLRLQLVIPETPLVVRGDAARLQQVFWNLLSNATKFSPSGASVQASAACEDGTVLVKVVDTGQGIRSEFLPHVFDTFRQEDASRTRRQSGLGLGLSIVRHLTEAHGGTVSVHSDGPGQGATFTVCLPSFGGLSPDVRPTDLSRPDLRGLRVLIVEDEADTRDLIGRAIGDLGAEVTAVSSANEARSAISKRTPDAIVSDIGMPDEDGFTFMRLLRRSEHAHIPAIALTAYASESDRAEAIEAGYQEHLAKPVPPYQLARVIVAAVRRPS
jgi:signal transduction histidine kinase